MVNPKPEPTGADEAAHVIEPNSGCPVAGLGMDHCDALGVC